MPNFRRRRFGHAADPVGVHRITQRRKGKCRGCGQPLTIGDTVVVLRVRKAFKVPCPSCGKKPSSSKRFHPHCLPPDHVKAMGIDVNAAHARQASGAVPPPPKPQTAQDSLVAWMLAGENALKRKLAENPALKNNPELEAVNKTYQSCKARFLRPGTDAEGVVAMKMALKKLVDVVMFNL